MHYTNWWYLTLVGTDTLFTKPLQQDITTEVCVIGGGVAGLHAALELHHRGKKVVLLEKTICGGGMSGKSGGFLTPDSELGLRQIEHIYGQDLTKKIRDFGNNGQKTIYDTITDYTIGCDLRRQDSLLLGLGKKGKSEVGQEYAVRNRYGFDGQMIQDASMVRKRNSGTCYTSALRYDQCFGINPIQYCQGLKTYLLRQGVQIFESSEVHKIQKNQVYTNLGSVNFDHCIVCPGKVAGTISSYHDTNTYGVKNFICVSEPLSKQQIEQMMPGGECMCRDTQLVFTYYRIIQDGRLVLGGGNPVSAFLPLEVEYPQVIDREIKRLKKQFSLLEHVSFQTYWSGRIEVTKDMMPTIDHDVTHYNHLWVQGAVGLPRAAACGRHAVQKLFHEDDKALSKIFSKDRNMLVSWAPHNNFLKSVIFGLCNGKRMGLF